MVRQRELTRGLTVSEVMGTKPRTETVTPYHTFGQVLDSVIHGYQEDFPVVEENGNLVGMITREEIMAAAHSPQRYTSVRELIRNSNSQLGVLLEAGEGTESSHASIG